MIAFLPQEYEEFRSKVRKFCENVLEKNAMRWDEEEEFPYDSLKAMAEEGILGLGIPEEYGGAGTNRLKLVIAIEEVARVDPNSAFIMEVESLFDATILLFGSEEQKKILKDVAQGKKIGTFALTEPTGGTDVAGIKSIAKKENDRYLLYGSKYFITNALVASYFVVFAKTAPELKGKGITAFLVEKGTENFRVGPKIHLTGFRGSAIAGLQYNGAPVKKENIIGKENEGIKVAMTVLERGRVNISALALGMLQRVYEESVKFANFRKSMENPIVNYQFIQNYLTDMLTDLEASRLMVYNTAMLIDRNMQVGMNAASTKLFVSEALMRHVKNGVEIMGGYGYTRGTVMERLARDAHNTTLSLGTSEAMRLVLSRYLRMQ
ncbi:MAG: acyl-CoA dehydrogenase family protein [Thermoplasmata archaeon]|jgi:alkylation response protein AidB-like acyl-CoA dehydrogenase|nr:acyl-CoA dehydrogenase [Thermoplasmatales archaeon]PMP74901.1 MAG: acyl-CoA dehydrogenase [Aciduliprofundum sp.]